MTCNIYYIATALSLTPKLGRNTKTGIGGHLPLVNSGIPNLPDLLPRATIHLMRLIYSPNYTSFESTSVNCPASDRFKSPRLELYRTGYYPSAEVYL